MATLTPNEAAKAAHVSRGTIMNAINALKIKARRANTGWQIDRDSFDSWLAGRGVKSDMPANMSEDDVGMSELAELRTEKAVLVERLASKDDLIARLENEVEYLRQLFWKRITLK